MNKKISIVIILTIVAVSLMTGCGASSGTGRYVVPSEISGGSGSGTGEGGSGGGYSPGGQVESDVNTLITSAWSDFGYGAYSSAINKFNEAAMNTNVTATQLAEANNGLGWALTKANGAAAGLPYFLRAADLIDESKLGLAAAYIQNGDYENAKNYLEVLGLNNTSFTFTTVHSVGVTNAEAHAMLSLAYFMTGDRQGCIDQIKCATANDLSSDSTVKQIRNVLLTLDPTLANYI